MTTAEQKYEWPDTDPPDEFGGGVLNINGIQYKKAEVSPGHWQWVMDDEAMKHFGERDRHRRDLFWALRSRILTDTEMDEVARYGDDLNIESFVPYSPQEKMREMNDALLQQFKLRAAAKR